MLNLDRCLRIGGSQPVCDYRLALDVVKALGRMTASATSEVPKTITAPSAMNGREAGRGAIGDETAEMLFRELSLFAGLVRPENEQRFAAIIRPCGRNQPGLTVLERCEFLSGVHDCPPQELLARLQRCADIRVAERTLWFRA